MNNLSWFLYLAEVVGNVGGVLASFAILSGITAVGWACARAAVAVDRDQSAQAFAHFLRFVPWIFVTTTFLATIIPSRDTIYLIAASEAGEMVVNTPEAKEIMSDLKEILSVQLNKLKQ